MGKTITILGVIAATIVFIAEIISLATKGGLVAQAVLAALDTSIVLIVATVPEGLPTIVAVTLSLNIIKLSHQKALVRMRLSKK